MENIEPYLEAIADDFGVDLDTVEEQYQTETDEYHSNYVGSADELENMADFIAKKALKATRAHFNAKQNMRGGGKHVEILAYGNTGFRPWTNKDDPNYKENPPEGYEQPKKTMLFGYGIAEIDGGLEKAAIILDETDGVDLSEARDLLQFGTTFTGRFSVQEGTLGYILWSTEDTAFTTETVNIPTDEDLKKKTLQNFADHVNLMDIENGMTATQPGTGYTVDFGVDLKYIRGQVVGRVPPAQGRQSAIYTLHDDSHMDETELEDLPIVSEEQRTTGLTAFVAPEMATYGLGSICDFYGQVKENRDGQIILEVAGVDPMFPRPVEPEKDDDNVTGSKVK